MKKIILSVIFLALCQVVFASDGPKPEGWMLQDIVHEGQRYVRDDYWKENERMTKADLDGDGQDEVIVSFRSNDAEDPRAITAIYNIQGDKRVLSKAIVGMEYLGYEEVLDVDKDGVKDLVLYNRSGNHYTYITIYSFKDGEYKLIFENGTPCYLHSVDADKDKAEITIGRENWDDPEFCYANSDEKSLREVYVWDGKEFVYSKDLSTTPWIGEKQALELTWQSMKKNMDNMEDDGKQPTTEDNLRSEYAAKMWNGGSRAAELFKEDIISGWEDVYEKELEVIYKNVEEAVEAKDIERSDFWLARYMGITTFNSYTERNYSDLFPLFKKREDLKPTSVLSDKYSDSFVDFFINGPNQFWGASDDVSDDESGIIVKTKPNKEYYFQFTISPMLEAWTLLGADSATAIIPLMSLKKHPVIDSGKLEDGNIVKKFEDFKTDIGGYFLQYIWPIEFYDLDGDEVPEIWMRYNRTWATGFSQVLDIYKIENDEKLVLYKRFEGLAEGVVRRLSNGKIEVGIGFSAEGNGHMGYDQTHFEIFEYKGGEFAKISERNEPHILWGEEWRDYYFGE